MILYLLFFVVAFYFFYKKNNRETFISSDKFRGEKKGYVFKKDTKGLGYYQDIF